MISPVAGFLCHVCRESAVDSFPMFHALRRAASDGRPWPSGGSLGLCTNCGATQKLIDRAWRAEAGAIYSQYDIYHQAIDGAEQAVFDQKSGAATPRSTKILEGVADLIIFPGGQRMLDVGCGNGPMLRAFSAMFPGWELNGLEPNVKSKKALLNIPGVKEIHECTIEEIPEKFDLISIMHALEHIENPVPFLAGLRDTLSPDGRLLIEVPYFPDNPFDLLIADHCTHFTVETMLQTLAASGLEAMMIRTDLVTKEITAVARRALRPNHMQSDKEKIERVRCVIENALGWLEQVINDAKSVAQSDNFGLFGTSISANWLYGELERQVKFFIDEDPNRIGTIYHGRPVFHPQDAPLDSDVFMALPRLLAEQIVFRIKSQSARFHLSPAYQADFSEAPFIAEGT